MYTSTHTDTQSEHSKMVFLLINMHIKDSLMMSDGWVCRIKVDEEVVFL